MSFITIECSSGGSYLINTNAICVVRPFQNECSKTSNTLGYTIEISCICGKDVIIEFTTCEDYECAMAKLGAAVGQKPVATPRIQGEEKPKKK